MEYALQQIAQHVGLAVEAVAILMIAIGSVEAIVGVLRVMLAPGASDHQKRGVWMRYARWLVAGLTFQLAGDIVHTAIAPTWDDIGRLAAIAVVRTFLTYFLDRDVEKLQEAMRVDTEKA